MDRLAIRDEEDSVTSSSGDESLSESGASSNSRASSSSPRTAQPSAVLPRGESDGSEDDTAEERFNKWEANQAPVIPHKVLKLRKLVFEAFHCALSIIADVQAPADAVVQGTAPRASRPLRKGEEGAVRLDAKEPWMRLSRVVAALKGASSGLKEEEPASERCLACFRTIMSSRIVALTEDKAYLKSLAKNEAKAVPSLLKAWSKLQDTLDTAVPSSSEAGPSDMGNKEQELVLALDTAPVLILRLASYSLLRSPQDGLDLSSLGVRSAALEAIGVAQLCEVMGVSAEGVDKLNVSQNGWKRFPAWSPFPFPNLESLDLTNNPSLAHLPFSLLRLPICKIHIRGTQLADPALPTVRPPCLPPFDLATLLKRRTKSRGPPSLLHILLRIYATILKPHYPTSALSDLNLPPHVAAMLGGAYACEACDELQMPGQGQRAGGWLEKEVERGWAVEGRQIIRQGSSEVAKESWVPTKIVRVKGRVCRDCEGRYLRPIAGSYG